MEHVYWVIDRVLGGRPGPSCAPWNLEEFAQQRVGGIVSLCDNVSKTTLERLQIEHLQIDCQLPGETTEQVAWFKEVIPSVRALLERCRAKETAMVVHCHHGLDRTGVVLACLLIDMDRVSAADAITNVRRSNPESLRYEWHCDAIALFAEEHRGDL